MSTWGRFTGWLGFGRRAALERQLLDGQLRELRLATARLKAELAVMHQELEHAMALAAERRAETARLASLLPMIQQAFAAAAEQSGPIYLGYSPDVAPLTRAKQAEVIELEPAQRVPDEIVLDVRAAEATQRRVAAAGAHRRTA